jgi:nicotinate-nucleotide adenylyltransferase
MKRIGCFFGTFDPIHTGHLIIAQHMLNYAGVDEIRIIVSPQNPFKQGKQLTDDLLRLKMVQQALVNVPGIRESNVELSLPKPSYTANTLIEMRRQEPDVRFDLIMGSDNFAGFHRWQDPERIIEQHRVLVYPRPGIDRHISAAQFQGHSSINLIDAPLLDISATRIREMVAREEDVRFLVAEPVRKLIEKHRLYSK